MGIWVSPHSFPALPYPLHCPDPGAGEGMVKVSGDADIWYGWELGNLRIFFLSLAWNFALRRCIRCLGFCVCVCAHGCQGSIISATTIAVAHLSILLD